MAPSVVTTEVTLANIALGHLAISVALTDFDANDTAEDLAVRLFFDLARDKIARKVSLRTHVKRELLLTKTLNPNDFWEFQYDYPTDCLYMLRIVNDETRARTDARSSQVPFRIVEDNKIWTNKDVAIAEYISQNTDVSDLRVDVVEAQTFLLAYYIAPLVTGGDPFGLQPKMWAQYLRAMGEAASSNLNEQTDEVEHESEFDRDRHDSSH